MDWVILGCGSTGLLWLPIKPLPTRWFRTTELSSPVALQVSRPRSRRHQGGHLRRATGAHLFHHPGFWWRLAILGVLWLVDAWDTHHCNPFLFSRGSPGLCVFTWPSPSKNTSRTGLGSPASGTDIGTNHTCHKPVSKSSHIPRRFHVFSEAQCSS